MMSDVGRRAFAGLDRLDVMRIEQCGAPLIGGLGVDECFASRKGRTGRMTGDRHQEASGAAGASMRRADVGAVALPRPMD